MDKANKNLGLIQVLRGVASLLVVFFHVTINSNESLNKNFLFNFFSFGYSGVDIFFVLSGFIITYTSLKSISNPAKLLPFAKRRLVRIYPTYWIIASGFLLAQLLFPSFYKTHFDFNIPNLISTYLLLPDHKMVNGVSWTLTFELFFYLLFLLLFLVPKKSWVYATFFAYCISIIVVTFSGNFEQDVWIKLIFSPLNIEFFLGVLSAYLVTKIPLKFCLPLIILGSLIFLINGILNNGGLVIFKNDFDRVILFGLPAFLVIIGIVSYEIKYQVDVHNILLKLGEASYSLYLIHLPIVAAFVKLYPRLQINNDIVYNLLCLLLITLICFISIKFYQLIEKPIITRLNSSAQKKKYILTLPKG